MPNRRASHAVLAAVVAPGLLAAGGCSSTKARPAAEAPPPAPLRAVLGAGDEVELRFYYAAELNVQQQVRPDGKLSLQLVGDVDAAGLTPSDLDARLEGLYAQHLKYPEVSVIVRGSHAQRVTVGGEVARPGAIEMPAKLTLLEAILLSGGFDLKSADVRRVVVLRTDATTGRRVGYAVDLRDEMRGAATDPFVLQPTDLVYVPRTAIVDLNQYVSQRLGLILPEGLIYSRSLGDGSISVGNRND